MSNVVALPRPTASRSEPIPLGFYVRVGFNDHLELLDLIATGERGIDHEEVQSSKTAERLGLLAIEVQAFCCLITRLSAFGFWLINSPH